jgi:ubiquitin carboxyl-terminal hydrolase 25/28
VVSRSDLVEAYKAFDLPADGGGADDERIINLFQAQINDQGPRGQELLREKLGRIGRYRGSDFLVNASRQSVETVEDAYAWLGNGLNAQSPDDLVLTVFALKVRTPSPACIRCAELAATRAFCL